MRLAGYASVVVVVFGFSALTLVTQAAWTSPPTRHSGVHNTQELPPLIAIEGRVAAFDAHHHELALRLDGGQLQALRVDDGTSVFLRGRMGQVSDLSAGQRVSAAYESDASPPVLQWLELLDP